MGLMDFIRGELIEIIEWTDDSRDTLSFRIRDAELHKVVPIAYVNNTVTLAMVNPSNLVAFDDVRRYIKGVIIEPQVCTEEDFKKFMDTVYPDLMGITPEKKETAHAHPPGGGGTRDGLLRVERDVVRVR